MRQVCLPQILPLCLKNHVPTILLWHTNMWLFHSRCLIFNCLSIPLQVWHTLLSKYLIILVLWLNIIIRLSYIWYNLYHLLSKHPKVLRVSCKNYILNIIYPYFWRQCTLSQREGILICDRVLANPFQKNITVIQVTGSSLNSKSPLSPPLYIYLPPLYIQCFLQPWSVLPLPPQSPLTVCFWLLFLLVTILLGNCVCSLLCWVFRSWSQGYQLPSPTTNSAWTFPSFAPDVDWWFFASYLSSSWYNI